MEYLVGAVILAGIALIIYVATLAKMAERGRAREQDLDDWEGVLDVKRETKRELADPDELDRMHDKYNTPE